MLLETILEEIRHAKKPEPAYNKPIATCWIWTVNSAYNASRRMLAGDKSSELACSGQRSL